MSRTDQVQQIVKEGVVTSERERIESIGTGK